ncbi:MAG: site-specific integrase [Oribacterium sp.]|nr:site-specific integrase [Lachnospiraceae bacterium]MBR1856533.1 site-specific integrase [Oribacterium sp.]
MMDFVKTDPVDNQRYGVYTYRTSTEDGLVYSRSYIVVKNDYGIMRFTRLHEFAGFNNYKPITSDAEGKLYYICGMLNYVLVEHGSEFGVKHVFKITTDMLQKFFDAYAYEKKPDGGFRSKETICRCISVVTHFMSNLAWKYGNQVSVKRNDLYRDHFFYDRQGRKKREAVPAFQVTGIPEVKKIFRELPDKAFEILIPMAFRYVRDIAFGLCVQAFTGLRAGEVCNMRQEDSPIGPGVTITEINGAVIDIKIDITREVKIRKDDAEVAYIKKEREQHVPHMFRVAFCEAYRKHKEYLSTQKYDKSYCPMFINENGDAMSYEVYRTRFKKLINTYLRPYLIKSSDPELRLYGQLLYENELGTHCLRHWYTQQLVLAGGDIGEVQHWRGDSNPQSAFEYLQNKGDIAKELQRSNERLLDVITRKWEDEDDGSV